MPEVRTGPPEERRAGPGARRGPARARVSPLSRVLPVPAPRADGDPGPPGRRSPLKALYMPWRETATPHGPLPALTVAMTLLVRVSTTETSSETPLAV